LQLRHLQLTAKANVEPKILGAVQKAFGKCASEWCHIFQKTVQCGT